MGLTGKQQAIVDKIKGFFSGKGRNTPMQHFCDTWVSGRVKGVPVSYTTGEEYTGSNLSKLKYAKSKYCYSGDRWITKAEMDRLGLDFKDIEKIENPREIPYVILDIIPGKIPSTLSQSERTVYNEDQVEGLDPCGETEPTGDISDRMERAILAWKDRVAPIIENSNIGYHMVEDEIWLPPRTHYKMLETYYQTVLHELAHSTGHESRLNRELRKASVSYELYAAEELAAEIASLFAYQEIVGDVPDWMMENSLNYLGAWLAAFNKNPSECDLDRIIQRAAEAADYIVDKVSDVLEQNDDKTLDNGRKE